MKKLFVSSRCIATKRPFQHPARGSSLALNVCGLCVIAWFGCARTHDPAELGASKDATPQAHEHAGGSGARALDSVGAASADAQMRGAIAGDASAAATRDATRPEDAASAAIPDASTSPEPRDASVSSNDRECPLPEKPSCERCYERAVTDDCSKQEDATRRSECRIATACIDTYCIERRGGKPSQLAGYCDCVASCLPSSSDDSGCATDWRDLLACIEKTCEGC